jgi:hypothetical protein
VSDPAVPPDRDALQRQCWAAERPVPVPAQHPRGEPELGRAHWVGHREHSAEEPLVLLEPVLTRARALASRFRWAQYRSVREQPDLVSEAAGSREDSPACNPAALPAKAENSSSELRFSSEVPRCRYGTQTANLCFTRIAPSTPVLDAHRRERLIYIYNCCLPCAIWIQPIAPFKIDLDERAFEQPSWRLPTDCAGHAVEPQREHAGTMTLSKRRNVLRVVAFEGSRGIV